MPRALHATPSRISSTGWSGAAVFETAPADNLRTLALVEEVYRRSRLRNRAPATDRIAGWDVRRLDR